MGPALPLRGDDTEALVFKGLLLRSPAHLEKNAQRQKELLSEAVSLTDKVAEIRKRQAEQPAPP